MTRPGKTVQVQAKQAQAGQAQARWHVDAPAWALVIAGATGAAAAVFLAVVPAAVDDDRFSYPLTVAGFTVIQVYFFVHHLALAWGLYAVWRRGFGGAGAWVWLAGALSGLAMTLLAVQELVAISAADAAYPSAETDVIESIYGVLSMLNGVALIGLGVAVAAAHRWRGWRRWTVLALGIYVFVPMTPAIFGPFVVARLAIGGWMVLFVALGWALLRPDPPH
jgi:hypothetical protein